MGKMVSNLNWRSMSKTTDNSQVGTLRIKTALARSLNQKHGI